MVQRHRLAERSEISIPTPPCRRSHAELFPIDLLQFLLRPDLDIYFGNKTTAKTKQPIHFKQSQPNEYSFIKNKFPWWIRTWYCLHKFIYILRTYLYFNYSFSKKRKTASLRSWGWIDSLSHRKNAICERIKCTGALFLMKNQKWHPRICVLRLFRDQFYLKILGSCVLQKRAACGGKREIDFIILLTIT